MKLATYDDGTLDGQLWVVSRDLTRAVRADTPNLLTALQDWETHAPALQTLSDQVNTQDCAPFDPSRCLAPLPRAPGWLDASAFLNHGRLMDQAFGNDPIPDFETIPLVYQGASDDFRGPLADVEFPDDADMIDMEGEFGVILGRVPLGASTQEALSAVRLLVQINDWSLRRYGPSEMRRGFGFLLAKPATAFAPLAITPDEIGPHWQAGCIHLALNVWINDRQVGRATGAEMHFDFGQIIAHCARTRHLSAGTVIGSGTVSNADRAAGSSCISEIRVIEKIDQGAAETPFLSFGDRVKMQAILPDGSLPFGTLDQKVVQA